METFFVRQNKYLKIGEFLINGELMDDRKTLVLTVNKPGTDPESGPCVDIWVKPDLTTTHENCGGIE